MRSPLSLAPPLFAMVLSMSCSPRVHDDSTATTALAVAGLQLPTREARTIRGEIASIAPSNDAGATGWLDIGVRTNAGVVSFQMLAGERVTLPITLGESIEAQFDCTRYGGQHHICDGVVFDHAGTLLVASGESGNIAIAPKWTLMFGPEIENRGGRRERALVLTHAGRTAVTQSTAWRQLHTPDGTYLVRGSRIDWLGKRPPEGVDYASFLIVRVGP